MSQPKKLCRCVSSRRWSPEARGAPARVSSVPVVCGGTLPEIAGEHLGCTVCCCESRKKMGRQLFVSPLLLCLSALACIARTSVQAHPSYLGGCAHPTTGLGPHGAPVADRYGLICGRRNRSAIRRAVCPTSAMFMSPMMIARLSRNAPPPPTAQHSGMQFAFKTESGEEAKAFVPGKKYTVQVCSELAGSAVGTVHSAAAPSPPVFLHSLRGLTATGFNTLAPPRAVFEPCELPRYAHRLCRNIRGRQAALVRAGLP